MSLRVLFIFEFVWIQTWLNPGMLLNAVDAVEFVMETSFRQQLWGVIGVEEQASFPSKNLWLFPFLSGL